MSKFKDKLKYKAAECGVALGAIAAAGLMFTVVAKAITGLEFTDVLLWTYVGVLVGCLTGLCGNIMSDSKCASGYLFLMFILALSFHNDLFKAIAAVIINILAATAAAVWIQAKVLAKYEEQNQNTDTTNLRNRRKKNRNQNRNKKTY